jgi:SAM-dependent methyltransferase
VDFSAHILDGARHAHGALPGVGFRLGEAVATGLPDACADVVFERALVHHVPDLAPVVAEAARLLRPGGVLLIQDRTPEDVAQPGSATHPRGWLFEVFPRLLEVENARRPTTAAVAAATAAAAGLGKVVVESLWEVRRRYPDRADHLAEIAAPAGRSIRMRLPEGSLVERDRWTLWRVERPAV